MQIHTISIKYGSYNREFMNSMVLTAIFTCLSNSILISKYFSINFRIWHLQNIYKILSDAQVSISTAIFVRQAEFKVQINPSWLIITHSPPPPLPLYHHSCPCPCPWPLQHHPSTCLWALAHKPLPSIERCGLDFHCHYSLTSKDAVPAAPPLSKGM